VVRKHKRSATRSDPFLTRARWFFLIVLVILLYMSLVIVRPVLNALIMGGVAAYVVYPLFKLLRNKTKRHNFSAFVCSLLGVIALMLPLFFLANSLLGEIGSLYGHAKQAIIEEDIFLVGCGADNPACKPVGAFNRMFADPEVKATLASLLREIVGKITGAIQGLVFALPKLIVFWFVTVFSMFYLLRDGHTVVEQLKHALPIEKHHQELIFSQLHNTLMAVVYGTLAIALAQALLALLGFAIFGVPNPVFWSIVLAFFAFIPFIGSWIVWLPASAVLVVRGQLLASNVLMWQGLGLFLYGLVVISGVENVLRPLLVGSTAKIPTLLVVLGVVGGVMVFGPIGFIIGPIVLSMFKTFFDIYRQEHEVHRI